MSSKSSNMESRLLDYYDKNYLTQYLPAVARLDGRGFSKFTKNMKKPYDEEFGVAMRETAKYLAKKYHATLVHTQSDEITMLFDYRGVLRNNMLFKGNVDKINSCLAGEASVKFNQVLATYKKDFDFFALEEVPHLDCRIASYPSAEEATNVFLWRHQDCVRNSVQMLARSHYSHAQCQNKSTKDLLTMLDQDGINWADYPEHFKNGLYYRKRAFQLDVEGGEPVYRNRIEEICYNKFSSITNRVEVVFNDEDVKRNTLEKEDTNDRPREST